MSLTLIICAWLLLPSIVVWVAIKFYVPWFLARHRDRGAVPPDELARRRALRAASSGSGVAQRLRLR
jgi:hypothetical protein